MKTRTVSIALTALLFVGIRLVSPSVSPSPPVENNWQRGSVSSVTEVTLGKNMLAFAAKFMNGKDQDEAATRRLIEGLDGILRPRVRIDKKASTP